LVARLSALSEQAEKLPQLPISVLEKATPETTQPVIAQSTWLNSSWDQVKKFVFAAGRALSNMVIISKDTKSIPILLTSEEHTYVITNIQSQLGLAAWAAIHRQPNIYRQSLSQVEIELGRYFATDNATVKSMQNALKELANITVNP